MMKVGIFNNNSYDGIHSSDTERTWIKNKKNAHVSGRRRKCPQNMNFPFTLGKIGALITKGKIWSYIQTKYVHGNRQGDGFRAFDIYTSTRLLLFETY